MSDMDRFIRDQHTRDLLRDTKRLEQLRDAPETQRLFSMLSRSTGQDLEQTSREDPAQLISAIKKLMQDPEGAKLIRNIKDRLE